MGLHESKAGLVRGCGNHEGQRDGDNGDPAQQAGGRLIDFDPFPVGFHLNSTYPHHLARQVDSTFTNQKPTQTSTDMPVEKHGWIENTGNAPGPIAAQPG
jgi:hypothetical protein